MPTVSVGMAFLFFQPFPFLLKCNRDNQPLTTY